MLARRFFLAPIAASSVHLLHCSVFCGAASSSVQTSASLHPSSSAPGQQYLPDGSPPQRPRPATNLIRRRRSSVWLAIWRTWAGFANSQHRDAALAIPNNICAHSSLLPHWAAAQTDANLSAHLHRLPTPPPYLRQMRLSPGRVRGCWVLDETFASQGLRCWVANDAASCPCRSSCKSPSTPRNCKRLIIRQLTFEAVRGGLYLSSPSTVLKVNYLFIRHLCF